MDGYLSWDDNTITDFSEANVSAMYERGFVFTRLGKGQMTQTRSVRVDLSKFELNSENRRILRKVDNIELNIETLPHPNYDWRIHKLGFDFYTAKFGPKTFSANKIKELLTSNESNYNKLFVYQFNNAPVGYCICFENNNWLHYGYPFYDLNSKIDNLGIGMMTKAIAWAKENSKKYVCLGSAQNPSAVYKLQFAGVEWFDGQTWRSDAEELKKILLTGSPLARG
ncbi:MAG: hypothetical protein NTW66_04075 [Candidatus Magasanikbacteria bacterium]|nr:hypothetical protein [Candidatus Magasanikbacteria bacterium]